MSYLRPDPAERMAELLAADELAGADPRAAWERAWHVMVLERAWPHSTRYRRAWRTAMLQTYFACREALLSGAPLDGWVSTCRERKVALTRREAARP